MDTEMTDPSVDITTPAAIGANPTAIGDSEAGPSGVQKRQKVAGNECSDTIYLVSPFNEAEEVILSRMKFHLASQRRLVPDVALGEVYQQMKLGMESFSDWWKQFGTQVCWLALFQEKLSTRESRQSRAGLKP